MNDIFQEQSPETGEPKRRRRSRAKDENSIDAEAEAIRLCTKALEPLRGNEAAVERVLAYVKDRLQIG